MKMGALGAMALLLLVAFAGTTTVGCPPVITETWCEYDLIAGQDEDAGTVEIYYKSQGENTWLEIYIITEDGWKIDESHVDIQYLPENFPATKKGNFKIGKFEYSTPTSATSTQHYYNIADGWVVDGCGSLVIAVHAVVYKGCGEEAQWETAWGNGEPFGGNWQMYINFPCCKYPDYPTGIDLKMWWTHWGAESYWDVTILEDGSYDLDDYDNIDYDTYVGWCVDRWHTMTTGSQLADLIDPWDWDPTIEWDKINWIINHRDGYSRQEVQDAIWYYTDGIAPSGNAAVLKAAAEANGEGFRPSVGQMFAIVVDTLQGNIIELDP